MSVSTIDRPVSALRQRVLDDIAMRGLRSDTQRDYIRVVRSFAAFLERSPDTATAEDIRRFQVHQHESGVHATSVTESVGPLNQGHLRHWSYHNIRIPLVRRLVELVDNDFECDGMKDAGTTI